MSSNKEVYEPMHFTSPFFVHKHHENCQTWSLFAKLQSSLILLNISGSHDQANNLLFFRQLKN